MKKFPLLAIAVAMAAPTSVAVAQEGLINQVSDAKNAKALARMPRFTKAKRTVKKLPSPQDPRYIPPQNSTDSLTQEGGTRRTQGINTYPHL